eukprot:m.1118132 g.1118132  ORF g.1118132 m.1118132 type:complete len:865 (+) comp24382_c1_seq3:350-2944(+)
MNFPRKNLKSTRTSRSRIALLWVSLHLGVLVPMTSSGSLNGKTRNTDATTLSKAGDTLSKRFGKEVLSVYAKTPGAVRAVGKDHAVTNTKMYTKMSPRNVGFGVRHKQLQDVGTEDDGLTEPTYPRADLSRRDVASAAHERARDVRENTAHDMDLKLHAEIGTAVGHGTAGDGLLNDAMNTTAAFVDPAEIDFPDGAAAIDKEAAPKQKFLADIINEKDSINNVQFGDKKTNFRTKRVVAAIEAARNEALRRLEEHASALYDHDENMTDEEYEARMEDLEIAMIEVNSTYMNWISSTNQLQRVLERNYSNTYDGIEKHQKRREYERKLHIERLQLEAIREEEQLKKLSENAKILTKIDDKKEEAMGMGDSKTNNAVDRVLDKVDEDADLLKKKIEDPVFQKAQFDVSAKLLTVVKITGVEEGASHTKDADADDDGADDGLGQMTYLVDGSNNKYALMRPKDTTIMPDDLLLMHDIIVILVACFLLGYLFSALGLPALIGHMFAGILLGPAGLNMISALVQISSIGELGVYFVLFSLGLEFSIAKLKEVWQVALVCGTAMLVLTVCAGVTVGMFLHRSFSESLYISVCIALSSTAIVANSMTASEADSSYGRVLIGILLMQDVYLGAIVAVTSLVMASGMPTFFGGLVLVGRLVLSLALVVVVAAMSTKLLSRVLHSLQHYDSSVRVLALLSVCFVFMGMTNALGVSNELGCFIAGVTTTASLHTRETSEHAVVHLMVPVRDIFLAVFFANVGTHIYPMFLIDNAWLLLSLSVVTMLLKYAVGFAVWLLVWQSTDVGSGHIISAGLCQISEFSFVLASRGTRLGIIPQPVYFLLLTVGGISLLMSPGVWILARRTARILPDANAK